MNIVGKRALCLRKHYQFLSSRYVSRRKLYELFVTQVMLIVGVFWHAINRNVMTIVMLSLTSKQLQRHVRHSPYSPVI